MTERHDNAMRELKALLKGDPDNIALIICGSAATGEARDDSDIDLYLVVTDGRFERVNENKSFFYGSWDPDKFGGVEIDGKIVGMHYLRDAVENASEHTRYSFRDAYTLFSRTEEVDDLIKKIHVYPEWERAKRIRAFYAYVKHYRYVGENAFRRGNTLNSIQCVMQLVFFACRLVLAHNRRLFPGHKALLEEAGRCADAPRGFVEMSGHLLAHMSPEEMIRYHEKVIDYFREYDYPDEERIGIILANEWTWYTRQLTISEW